MKLSITLEKGSGQYFIAYTDKPIMAFSIRESPEKAVASLISANKFFKWENMCPKISAITVDLEKAKKVQKIYENWTKFSKHLESHEKKIWQLAIEEILLDGSVKYNHLLYDIVRPDGHFFGLQKRFAFLIFDKVWNEIVRVINLPGEEFEKQFPA